jgi:hypothetical protein
MVLVLASFCSVDVLSLSNPVAHEHIATPFFPPLRFFSLPFSSLAHPKSDPRRGTSGAGPQHLLRWLLLATTPHARDRGGVRGFVPCELLQHSLPRSPSKCIREPSARAIVLPLRGLRTPQPLPSLSPYRIALCPHTGGGSLVAHMLGCLLGLLSR